MLNIQQFKNEYIIPTLQTLNMYSDVATNLVLGTAIQESLLTFVQQTGGGPALGYYQMEPATHKDCWISYLYYRPELASTVWNIAYDSLSWYTPGAIPDDNLLVTNHSYSTAMCRIRYKRAPAPLPTDPNDIMALAMYWKSWYNTPQGRGQPQEFYNNYTRYIGTVDQ